jgi:hypothetical protein
MSSSGGGHIILARSQLVWTNQDFTITLTLQNDTDSSVTVTSDQCAAMVSGLDPGDYHTSWNGTSWSTPTQ